MYLKYLCSTLTHKKKKAPTTKPGGVVGVLKLPQLVTRNDFSLYTAQWL